MTLPGNMIPSSTSGKLISSGASAIDHPFVDRSFLNQEAENTLLYTDMENNLIESLLYDSPKPLGLLLSERFNEHVHFTHLSPTYVVHFLMGLSSMLMSDHIRTKYGIEGVFFTHFGPEKIVRLTILTAPVHNTPGRKTIKSNHLSGYLAGWIMSSENKDSESYSLLGRTDTRSTKFFIRSTKREDTSNEVQLMPTNVLLIIKEEKMSNMHFPDTYALDEEYVRYNRLNAEDTVVINIGQEYVHSTRDFLTTDNEQDFARYTVSISFAKSDDIVESHAFFALPKVPLSTFHSLTDDLTDVMKQELTQLFRSGSFFANTGSDLVAFLDGIFLDNQCLKSTKKLESTHSDVYYIRKLGGPRMLKMNFKIMSDRMTEQEFIEIAKSANEELQTSMWKDESQFFQFVLSEKDGILDVQFLDTGRLSTCAGVRLRRGSLHQCLIDLDAGAIKNSEKNQDPDQSRTVDEINVVKAYKSLVKVLKISRYMMLGFMVRDAISDAVNKHYGAAAMDIGFLLASVYSPTLGEMAKTTANALLETGSKFSGYALKTLSFGIERAISIYVFTDLIENAIAYGKDSKNTNAGIGLAIDAAFLTIDLVTAAAEAFGAFTFMTPVGQIASVLLIVGMNVYQTVKTVEQIEQILPLNTGEVIDESLRAFFHVNPEDYIRKLMSEKLANSELMQQALDYLKKQSNIDTYITGSAEFSGNVLVMHDRLIRNDYTGSIKVASECDDNCIQKHTPTCTNAFGISKKLTSNDKAALFKLGNGSDLVYGYDEKPNIFLMAGGVKNVTGGSMNDTFVVGIGPITATIEGLDGMDMLDLSSFSPDKLNIDGNILEYELGSIRSHLMIKNIETIILPIGGKVKNSSRSIDQGLILELSENTNVTNYAKEGAISYLIRANDNMGLQYTSLSILGESGAKQEIFFLQNLWDLENMTYNQDGTLSFLTINGQGIRLYASRNILEKTRIIFNDGSMISLNNSILLSATLSTDRTIQQIEHMYVNVLERLGILMVAYSSSDDESVTISHGKILESRSSVMSQILHNSVDHSTHMVLNGGQYLILINTNPQGKLEDTSIKSRNANNLTEVIIDLSDVIEFHMRDDSSFIELEAYLLNQSDLHVEVKFKKSDSLVLLGNIVIRDILRDDLYSKIRIRNYGELNINLHDRARNYYRVENATDQYIWPQFNYMIVQNWCPMTITKA
uniref:Uncharacterized protein n=1 Tax=Romanomermis culicivorax TaxID=13658 RepID=A0A915JTY7_ROMCU